MTKRLYYQDSYLTEFTSVVLEQSHRGPKVAVILDQTAFYPASGGQPFDTGLLGGAHVEVVEEDASGRIIHVLDAQPASTEVRGTIDWSRRFDHMQQHTGQHILSQAFLAVAQAPTLSFHLGLETSTIDIGLAQPDAAMLATAEALAARIVFEDRTVRILNVTRDELSALGVRKGSDREGEIRVIDVEGFDRSPCGGTHVRRTGEIGLILVLGGERYKGGTRIEFVCGGRALSAFRRDHESLRELGRLFSAHPHELPGLVEKFLLERSSLTREKKRLEDQILEMEAQELVSHAEKQSGIVAICRSYGDRKIENLKVLAQKVTAFPETLAILSTTQESAQLVVARHADLPGDCGAAVKQLASKLGGKGGGKPELAQAGGIALASLEKWSQGLLDYFRICRHRDEEPARTTDRAHPG